MSIPPTKRFEVGYRPKHSKYSDSQGPNELKGPTINNLSTYFSLSLGRLCKYEYAPYTILVFPAPGTEKLQAFCENAI